MEALKETTDYGKNVQNHTYLLDGTTLLAYQKFSKGEPIFLKNPITFFSKRGRTFVKVPLSLFKK